MIEYNLDTEHSILHVQPKSAIENDDFVKLAKAVDPHIEATGGLSGLFVIQSALTSACRAPLCSSERQR
jgi:hypothetical protein